MTSSLQSRIHFPVVLSTIVIVALLFVLPYGCGPAESPDVSKLQPSAPPPDTAQTQPISPVETTGETGPWLHVVGMLPLPGDMLKDQVVVFFDDQLAPAKAGADAAPDTVADPILFTPPMDGVFRIGPNFVAFRRADESRRMFVKAELNPLLESVQGRKVDPQQRQFCVSAAPFEPLRFGPIEVKTDQTVLGIEFPIPINIETFGANITVKTKDGAPVSFQAEQGTTDAVARIVLDGKTPWPVTVVLKAGMTDGTGLFTMQGDRTYVYPADTALTVTRADWGAYQPERQEIRVEFSAPVSANGLERFFKLTDSNTGAAIPFEVEPLLQGHQDDEHPNDSAALSQNRPLGGEDTARRVDLILHLERPARAKLSLVISAGVSAPGGVALARDYTTTLFRQAQPLTVSDIWWNNYGKDGLVLQFSLSEAADVRDVQSHLESTPPVANLRVQPSYGRGRYRVSGDWDSERSYDMRLKPGLKYGGGLVSSDTVRFQVKTQPVAPYVGFGQEGKYYFPRRNGLAFPIESRNIDSARILLHRMFPSNIAVAVNNLNKGDGDMGFISSWSEEIAKKDLQVARRPDPMIQTPLELDPLFPPDKKGVFCLQVTGKKGGEVVEGGGDQGEGEYEGEGDGEGDYEGGGRRYGGGGSTKIVLYTNIGVLAHWQADELVLFAHNLFSLAPLPSAKVTVYSSKNQLMGQGVTDEQGIVQLRAFNKALGAPRVAVVESQDDATFIELVSREKYSDLVDPQLPPYERTGYDAFLYADRDLYRPGETVHARWLVRTNFGDALANVPLVATVIKPNGRKLLTQTSTLSALGTGGLDVATEKQYPTGKYEVRLTVPGGDKVIGSYSFRVEEFVPNRMKAAVSLPLDRWLPGKEYGININAQHLFGAPAAERKCEATVLFKRGFTPGEAWKKYRFDNDSTYVPDAVQCGEAQTDEAGNASLKFSYRPPDKVTFPMKAVVVGRVFELGGRAVIGKAESVLFSSDVCLGVTAAPTATGRGLEVFAAAMDIYEKPAGLAKVNVTLERQEWNYYVRQYYNRNEPNWTESFEPVETREIALSDGKGSTTFDFSDSGYYRVKVHSPATKQYSTQSFYSCGGKCQIAETARPSLIKIVLDKAAYSVGDVATVRVESPFDGKGIVVLQGESLQKMLPVDIKNGAGSVQLKLEQAQCPNVWIEATVVHAIQEGRTQVYPFSSFAVSNLTVADPGRKVAVSFPSLPKEIRPATEAKFDVETRDSAGNPVAAELTLAAVDEGIHSITDYKNPDPIAWVGRARRPDLRYGHYYDRVAYDFEKPAAGGDAELRARMGALGETWIKPVALWSGVVQTDAGGHAAVTMKVPEFSGQLRLVAVACTPAALGAQAANLYVRRPYMLRTSMPRFVLPEDSIQCRATLHNTTDGPAKAKVTWAASGALKTASGSSELDLAARGEGSLLADIVVGNTSGQGEIRWEAVIADVNGKEVERLTETAPIPVSSPAVYQSKHELIVLKPGEERELRNTAFLDDERVKLELNVSASPLFRLQKALKQVVRYPYGCVEQTTSCLLPLYLLRQNQELAEEALDPPQPLDQYIQSGIYRLFSMQTANGALSGWPGGTNPYPYGSVYALHFLTLVKNGRSFSLPAEPFAELQNYARSVAKNSEANDASPLHLRAYALFVLALGGDLDALRQIDSFDTIKMPTTGRMLLAAALAQNTKDFDRARLYMAKPSVPYTARELDGTLNSDIRSVAIELMVLQQLGTEPDKLRTQADKLVTFVQEHPYGSTQETAFAITALTGYLSAIAANADQAAATIAAPDKKDTLTGRQVVRNKHRGPGGVFKVANTGSVDLFVNFTTWGVPQKVESAAVVKGLRVLRGFFTSNMKGFPDGKPFKQGDTYIVRLGLTCDRSAKNVVLADLLPAGFEIENPRLDSTAMPGKDFKDTITPTHMEIRDDRLILVFDKLNAGIHTFYYVVRAVTPGKYLYPPVTAECMYDGTIHGSSALGSMEVKQ